MGEINVWLVKFRVPSKRVGANPASPQQFYFFASAHCCVREKDSSAQVGPTLPIKRCEDFVMQICGVTRLNHRLIGQARWTKQVSTKHQVLKSQDKI